MVDTYSQLYIQVVFAVKFRQCLIMEKNREELQKIMSGIISNRGAKVMAIYCMPDHTHILINIQPTHCLSDIVKDVKAGTSVFINDNNLVKGKFNWQNGFGAFSYSRGHLEVVVNYILNQKEHHRKKTFKEEYYEQLKEYEVEYKDEYLFEWL
jgi:putative transposase